MFNKHTETRVETLICGELRTAKEQHGEKFNSLHEAYAVALEELEEASVDFENTKTAFSYFWEDLSVYDECPVLGIAPDKVNNKDEYYIRIMIDTKEKRE